MRKEETEALPRRRGGGTYILASAPMSASSARNGLVDYDKLQVALEDLPFLTKHGFYTILYMSDVVAVTQLTQQTGALYNICVSSVPSLKALESC